MKLCLVIAADAKKRQDMRDAVEELGFVTIDAADGHCARLSAHGLLPDVIICAKGGLPDVGGPELFDQLRVLKNGKKPFMLFADQPDVNNLARKFVRQNLLDAPVRMAFRI